MKTPKTYRLSPETIRQLEILKSTPRLKDWTETDIIETAILKYYYHTIRTTEKEEAGD